MRGFLLSGLWQRFGFWPAAVASSLVWAGLHGVSGVLIPFTCEGLVLCWIRRRTGSVRTGTIDGATTELVFARDALRIAIATERSGLEFYTRAASRTKDGRGRSVFQKLRGSTGVEKQMTDVKACLDWLAKEPRAKAGKVGARGKAGRRAAARGAKKGTRGGRSKQTGRPAGKGDRRSALGRGPGSRGQGRTSAKGGRGKTGARQRPSPRKLSQQVPQTVRRQSHRRRIALVGPLRWPFWCPDSSSRRQPLRARCTSSVVGSQYRLG